MSWRRRKASQAPVPMIDRWGQLFRANEVLLDSFSQADLDAVTLDPECLPASVRGPAMREAAPLLAALSAQRDDSGDGPGSPPDPPLPTTGRDDRAATAARLERLGYIRPGESGPVDPRIPNELAGWSADPAADGPTRAGPRRVAICGDLGIITRIRSQPSVVAEASASSEPTDADPAAARWRLVARMYAAHSPPVALVERPAGPDGGLPPFTLLTEAFTLAALMGWCGVDVAELVAAGEGRSEAERRADAARQLPAVPTAGLAGGFATVAQLCVAHPSGRQVLLRRLIVASGSGQRWVLEGERAQRAVPVSVDQIGERLDAVFKAAPAPQEDGR